MVVALPEAALASLVQQLPEHPRMFSLVALHPIRTRLTRSL